MTKSVSGDGSSDLPSAASGVPRTSGAPATTFGRFRVLHKIGMGSLGPVFRGEDLTTLAPVVIKQLQLAVGPERTRQIADELEQLVRTLPQHPHLTQLLAAGISENGVTTVSSWAVGEGLDAALGAYGPAAIGDAVERLAQIADALDLAAAHQVWHGALHPADVIVSATDTHVTGVGVAAILEKAHVRVNVRLPYTAPEVVALHTSSTKSDQFALAAMAHEWLFGVPIAGPAESSMDVPRLPDVDHAALCDAFTTALAPAPDDRFATCAAFVDAVRAAASAPQSAPRVPPPVQGDLLGESTLVARAPLTIDEFPIVEAVPPSPLSDLTVVASAPAPPEHRDRSILVEPEKAVAWRGELAALPAASPRDTDRRGLSGAALAAVFVVGLALGGAGGYVVAQRRLPAAAPVSSAAVDAAPAAASGEPSDAARAGAAAPDSAIAAGRPFTDGSVPAAGTPPTPPVEARTESVAPVAPTPASPAPAIREPRQSPATARLLVRSSPGGAAVSVDGVARGTTPLVVRDLPIGARRVTLTRSGYATVERNITLSGDRPSRSIEVTLVPIARVPAAARPAPATAGSLLVESRPSGAAVTVDGQAAGTTPLTIASVAPGRHTVVIAARGMKPVTTTVIVKAGERARVAATLVGETQDE